MANVKKGTASKNISKKGGNEKKEYKNQNYKMRGSIERADLFCNDKHVRVTIRDEVSERKYVFVLFNVTDEQFDIIAESERLEVYFNISYNNYNNQIQLQLVATEIHNAD